MPIGIVPAPSTPLTRLHDPWEYTFILAPEDARCASCGEIGDVIPGTIFETARRFRCECGHTWGHAQTWTEQDARIARDRALGKPDPEL